MKEDINLTQNPIVEREPDDQPKQVSVDFHENPHKKISDFKLFGIIAYNSIQISSYIIIFEYICNVNIAFIGRLNNPDYIAAIGLCDIIIHFFGAETYIGLNEGFTSLAGRAFGAKQYRLIGSYLHKAFLILHVIFIAFLFAVFYAEDLLIAMGMPEESSKYAEIYLFYLTPHLYCQFMFDLLRAYLNCMEIYNIHSFICIFTGLLHPLLCYFLIDIGFHGMAIALSITQTINFILIVSYIIYYKPYPESLYFEFKSFFSGFYMYAEYVCFICLPIWIDLIFVGLQTLIVGTFKNKHQIAGHVTIYNARALFYSFFIGINSALITFSSNAVGKKDISECKILYKFCYYFGFLFGGSFVVLYILFNEELFLFYTTDQKTIHVMRTIMSYFLFFFVFDCLKAPLLGVLKGFGLGKQATFATFFSFWIVGIPSMLVLCYVYDQQVNGVWYGFCASIVSLCLLCILFIETINWEQLMQERHEEMMQYIVEELEKKLSNQTCSATIQRKALNEHEHISTETENQQKDKTPLLNSQTANVNYI